MAAGDQADMTARLLRLLPAGWFPAVAPQLIAVLQGVGLAFSNIYSMLAGVKAQMRVKTASGAFLDLAAQDYFGVGGLSRLAFEDDPAYQARILYNLTAPRGTRAGMIGMLKQLTGNQPIIFQPNLITDVGGGLGTLANPLAGGGGVCWQSVGGLAASFGSDNGGAWGTLTMPNQVFVIVAPPSSEFAGFVGYGGFGSLANPAIGGAFGLGDMANPSAGGSAIAWLNPDSVPGLITSELIYEQIESWMAAGYTAYASVSSLAADDRSNFTPDFSTDFT